MASIITAELTALSVAPVPVCHESKCAPIITISLGLVGARNLGDDVVRIERRVDEPVADVHRQLDRHLLLEHAQQATVMLAREHDHRHRHLTLDSAIAFAGPGPCAITAPLSPRAPGDISTTARTPSSL